MPMERRVVDIWMLHALMKEPRWSIVIPTNIGWKNNGCNVMGRGLAEQAAARYPELPRLYGDHCKKHWEKPEPYFYERGHLWCVPSKPLNEKDPAMSWMNKGSYPLIEKGLRRLRELLVPGGRCAVPLIGSGNAGLQKRRVVQIIEKVLGDDSRFILVSRLPFTE